MLAPRMSDEQELKEFADQLMMSVERIKSRSDLALTFSLGGSLPEMPKAVALLTHLKTLSSYKNDMEDICVELSRLTLLTELWLYENKISHVPDIFGGMGFLEALILSDNRIPALPPSAVSLTKLKKLELRNNLVSEFQRELCLLPALEHLNVSSNYIIRFPEEFSKLTNMTRLNIESNKLTIFPSGIRCMEKLVNFNMANNQVSIIPTWLKSITSLAVVKSDGNPIIFPAKINGQIGMVRLREMLEMSEQSDKEWNEGRILLFGEQEAGKSTLMKSLLLPKASFVSTCTSQSIATVGAEISTQTIEDSVDGRVIRLKIWDFGGQTEFQVTHPFFVSSGCVVLLVWNMKHSAKFCKLPEWLSLLHSVAPTCGVILVGTHVDHPLVQDAHVRIARFQEANQIIADNIKTLRYSGLVCVSNATGENIDQLKLLTFRLVAQHTNMSQPVPSFYFLIRNLVEEAGRCRDPPVISLTQVHDMVSSISNTARTKSILQLLHDAGFIVWHDQDLLREFIICHPPFLIRVFHQFFHFIRATRDTGVYPIHTISSHLEEIFPGMAKYIMTLFHAFQLSFTTDDGEYEVFPSLLPPGFPSPFVWSFQPPPPPSCLTSANIHIHLDAMPPALFGIIITKLHKAQTHQYQSRPQPELRSSTSSKYPYYSSSHAVFHLNDATFSPSGSNVAFEEKAQYDFLACLENLPSEKMLMVSVRSAKKDYPAWQGICFVVQVLEQVLTSFPGIGMRLSLVCPLCAQESCLPTKRGTVPFTCSYPTESSMMCTAHGKAYPTKDWMNGVHQNQRKGTSEAITDVPHVFWINNKNDTNTSLMGTTLPTVHLVCDSPNSPHLISHPGYKLTSGISNGWQSVLQRQPNTASSFSSFFSAFSFSRGQRSSTITSAAQTSYGTLSKSSSVAQSSSRQSVRASSPSVLSSVMSASRRASRNLTNTQQNVEMNPLLSYSTAASAKGGLLSTPAAVSQEAGKNTGNSGNVSDETIVLTYGIDITEFDPRAEWTSFLKPAVLWSGQKRFLCQDCFARYDVCASGPVRPVDTNVVSGYLWFQNDVSRVWRKRFFVLRDSLLQRYLDHTTRELKGQLDLHMCNQMSERNESDGLYGFEVQLRGKVNMFKTEIVYERNRWVYALGKAMKAAVGQEGEVSSASLVWASQIYDK